MFSQVNLCQHNLQPESGAVRNPRKQMPGVLFSVFLTPQSTDQLAALIFSLLSYLQFIPGNKAEKGVIY